MKRGAVVSDGSWCVPIHPVLPTARDRRASPRLAVEVNKSIVTSNGLPIFQGTRLFCDWFSCVEKMQSLNRNNEFEHRVFSLKVLAGCCHLWLACLAFDFAHFRFWNLAQSFGLLAKLSVDSALWTAR